VSLFFGSVCQPVVIAPLAAAQINKPPNAVRSLGGSSRTPNNSLLRPTPIIISYFSISAKLGREPQQIPSMGLSGVASAMVGQNLGASQARRAERAVRLIAHAVAGIMVIVLGCLALFAPQVMALFIGKGIGNGGKYGGRQTRRRLFFAVAKGREI
jgi:hypothetical protein